MKRAVVEALIDLCNGAVVASGRLPVSVAERLLEDGVLTCLSHGSRLTYKALSGLRDHLSALDERLANPEGYLELLSGAGEVVSRGGTGDIRPEPVASRPWTVVNSFERDGSRAVQVAMLGNSKAVASRSCPGFPVNSYAPVPASLRGSPLSIFPREGTFLYVADWQGFEIPPEVLVVGVENMENFRMVRQQRYLFEVFGLPVLFVSRYPQSGDLVRWLSRIPNRYLHFGDLDLAGINIYLTEFYNRLGMRASFFIPSDARERLASGSAERYSAQYDRFRSMVVSDPRVRPLVDLIHQSRRGYDQEGFIRILREPLA